MTGAAKGYRDGLWDSLSDTFHQRLEPLADFLTARLYEKLDVTIWNTSYRRGLTRELRA
jgi:hypothetical protein